MNTHIQALIKACLDRGLSYEEIGDSGVYLNVKINDANNYFIANQVPLNHSMVSVIVKDKGHTRDLLSDLVNMPRTLSFVDPEANEPYSSFVKEKSIQEIVHTCESEFGYPFVAKKNSGSQGINVFRCTNQQEAETAFSVIFKRDSVEYDHVALAQEYINIDKEYRVTVLNKNIELIYHKDNTHATFTGNLSPLHWESARSVVIEDSSLRNRLTQFIAPIYSALDLEYGGLDIAVDIDGKLWLLEINSHPGYNHLVADNGLEVLTDLYKKILEYITRAS